MALDADRYLLVAGAYAALADTLGEHVDTVISIHLLRRRLCRAYIVGSPEHCDAVVIENPGSTELRGFGEDASALYDLLESIPNWSCIDVAPTSAPTLGRLIEERMGVAVRYYADLHHALRRPVALRYDPAVRLLTLADAPLLEAAPEAVRAEGFGSARAMLAEGVVAAAIVEEQIVTIAFSSARSRDYADVAVATLEPWRNRGFAAAAAALVAGKIQEARQIPVWSTGEDNVASLRVAEKLGFTRECELTYVIPQ
jgi:GNAT superfamily N-acetyltransferase